ncbi:MAG: nucleoside deaminase [Candidatus Omnitrophica bacterium]|nr:nucleoside deaminase [Candidatus Omnitrophota bacterium]
MKNLSTSNKEDEKFMKLAIARAKGGVLKRQTPFGACIVKDGKVISCVHNKVWNDTDITAHAEVMAIREACKKIKSIDLSGSVIYSTCEPCPMCFSACHWARISKIVYGTSISDARDMGFDELFISNKKMKRAGGSSIKVIGGCLKSDNLELFRMWSRRRDKRIY